MKKFDKFSLRFKLLFFNSVLVIFLFILGGAAQFAIHSSNGIVQELASNQSSYWVNQSLIVKSDIQALFRVALEVYIETKGANSNAIKDVSDSIKTLEQNLDKYAAENVFSAEESEKFKKIKSTWQLIRKNGEIILEDLKQGKLNREKINEKILKLEDSFLNLNDMLSEVLGKLRTKTLAVYSDAQNKEKIYFGSLMVFLLIALIISITSFIFSIDLSNKFKNIGNELNLRAKDVTNVVISLKKSSESLATSIHEQSDSIHETTAAINEINSTVNRTTENTKELFLTSKASLEKSENGQSIMKKLVLSIDTIQESNKQLQIISEIIAQINSKTTVINDIVAKTELLSLNASIESARAGEHGKGFAVVAEEVGNLAKLSGKSAEEIKELINKSQEQVNKILGETTSRIDEVKDVTNLAQSSFLEISENISSLSNFIEQISGATQEQEIGISQISSAMEKIVGATSNIQSSSEVNKECSQDLAVQSNKLDNTSKDIQILIAGK